MELKERFDVLLNNCINTIGNMGQAGCLEIAEEGWMKN
jgi:hypothetical protein